MNKKQTHITLTPTQRTLLTTIINKSTSQQRLVSRARLVIDCAESGNLSAVAASHRVDRKTVRLWLARWNAHTQELSDYEQRYRHSLSTALFTQRDYQAAVAGILSDAPRPGAPPTITEAQKEQVIALAAQKPKDAGVPVNQWSHELLARTAVAKKIVARISSSHIGRFLKSHHPAASPEPVLGTPEH